MKLQSRQIIFIGSALLGIALVQISPSKAHEKKFHVPKKTSEPKIEKVIPETKINSESSNSSSTSKMKESEIKDNTSIPEEKNIGGRALNSVNSSEVNNINIVPKPGEIIFSILIGGTFLLYSIKQKIYK